MTPVSASARRLLGRVVDRGSDDAGNDDAGRDDAGRDDAGNDDAGNDDAGNAVVEFVFVALVVMVPLIYVIVLFATIQRDQLAVTTAAREAGRAFATAETPTQGLGRARVAAGMAYEDAGLGGPVQLSFVAPDAKCGSASVTPTLQPGSEFAVCVVDHDELPAVPVVFQGRHGLSSEGRFVVHVDDYR